LADIIVILTTMPLLLLCAIVPAGATFLFIRGRRNGSAPLQRLQRLLWRADNGLTEVRQKTTEIAPRVARPVISLHAAWAYLRTFLGQLREILFGRRGRH
jgi:hypothetical protein